MNWIVINESNKPEGVLLGFNKKWVHEDFNHEGVRLCHWCDVSGWVSSYWNNYHDCYDTRISSEDNESYVLDKKEDQVPTHYCKIEANSIINL